MKFCWKVSLLLLKSQINSKKTQTKIAIICQLQPKKLGALFLTSKSILFEERTENGMAMGVLMKMYLTEIIVLKKVRTKKKHNNKHKQS